MVQHIIYTLQLSAVGTCRRKLLKRLKLHYFIFTFSKQAFNESLDFHNHLKPHEQQKYK